MTSYGALILTCPLTGVLFLGPCPGNFVLGVLSWVGGMAHNHQENRSHGKCLIILSCSKKSMALGRNRDRVLCVGSENGGMSRGHVLVPWDKFFEYQGIVHSTPPTILVLRVASTTACSRSGRLSTSFKIFSREIDCHTILIAVSSSSTFLGRSGIRLSLSFNSCHIASIGLRSGEFAGHGSTIRPAPAKAACVIAARE